MRCRWGDLLCPGRGAAFFTMHRRAGTHVHPKRWTPDQQRTTPQARRAAQHPGNAKIKRSGRCRPGPLWLEDDWLLLAGNLVVDALDVEVHAEHLAVGEMIAALAFDGLAVLVHDRAFERKQLAVGN